MANLKSPGGSIFPYYFKGGEIHALKYGSKSTNHKALFEIMDAEAEFIIKCNRALRVWVDFYGTELNASVLNKFIENLEHLQNNLIRLAIVGFTYGDRGRFTRLSKKLGLVLNIPVQFFSDPEEAKTWLVSEMV